MASSGSNGIAAGAVHQDQRPGLGGGDGVAELAGCRGALQVHLEQAREGVQLLVAAGALGVGGDHADRAAVHHRAGGQLGGGDGLAGSGHADQHHRALSRYRYRLELEVLVERAGERQQRVVGVEGSGGAGQAIREFGRDVVVGESVGDLVEGIGVVVDLVVVVLVLDGLDGGGDPDAESAVALLGRHDDGVGAEMRLHQLHRLGHRGSGEGLQAHRLAPAEADRLGLGRVGPAPTQPTRAPVGAPGAWFQRLSPRHICPSVRILAFG